MEPREPKYDKKYRQIELVPRSDLNWMLEMAGGDEEIETEIRLRDEIGDQY